MMDTDDAEDPFGQTQSVDLWPLSLVLYSILSVLDGRLDLLLNQLSHSLHFTPVFRPFHPLRILWTLMKRRDREWDERSGLRENYAQVDLWSFFSLSLHSSDKMMRRLEMKKLLHHIYTIRNSEERWFHSKRDQRSAFHSVRKSVSLPASLLLIPMDLERGRITVSRWRHYRRWVSRRENWEEWLRTLCFSLDRKWDKRVLEIFRHLPGLSELREHVEHLHDSIAEINRHLVSCLESLLGEERVSQMRGVRKGWHERSRQRSHCAVLSAVLQAFSQKRR